MSLFRPNALLIATTLTLAPLPLEAQVAAPARVGVAFYEGAERVIVVPFTGAPPRAFYLRLTPTVHAFELEGARLVGPSPQAHAGVGALRRFTLTARRSDVVRLTLETSQPTSPSIRLNTIEQRFEIYPFVQPGAERPRPPATPRPSVLAPGEAPPAWFFQVRPTFAPSPPALRRPPTPQPARVSPPIVPSLGPALARRTPPPRPLEPPPPPSSGGLDFPAWLFPGLTPAPVLPPAATPLPRRTATPTPPPTIPPTPQPTPVPTPRPTPVPTPRPTPVPTPRPTPVPTFSFRLPPTPAPTAAPVYPPGYVPPVPSPLPPRRLATPTPRPGPVATPLPVMRPANPVTRPTRLEPPRTRFGTPIFAPERHALVLPFEGDPPNFEITALAPAELRVDFTRSLLMGQPVSNARLASDAVLAAWSASQDPARGVTSLRLALTGAGEVVVARDDARQELLVFPQLSAEGTPTPPGTVRTVLGPATYDEQVGGLALDYRGEVPRYTLTRLTRNVVYLDFPEAALNPTAVQFDTVSNALMGFWLIAPRMNREAVRAMIVLPFGGNVQLLEDQVTGRILLVPRLGD